MPKFYFYVHDDIDADDDEGQELPGLEAARAVALAGARGLAAEQVLKGRLNLSHHIGVADETGAVIDDILFGDAIAVEGSAGGAAG